jgi:hypothetical protein
LPSDRPRDPHDADQPDDDPSAAGPPAPQSAPEGEENLEAAVPADPHRTQAEEDAPPQTGVRPGLLQPRENAAQRRPQLAPASARFRAEPLHGQVIPPGRLRYRPAAADSTADLLRNPSVLAGLAVVAAIFLAVAFVFVFGGGPSGAGFDQDGGTGSVPGGGAGGLTPSAGGVVARSIASASVREGPSIEYAEIAVLRSGQDVEVSGRNQESSWFQVVYPRNSSLRGWVPGTALRLPDGSVERLQVAAVTPIPRPTVVIPTAPPEPTATPTPSATPTSTPGPGGPDLALSVQNNSCPPGAPLVLTIRNATGEAVTSRQVRITVSTPSGVLGSAETVIDLPAGASTSITTGIAIRAPRTTATVELLGAPPDPNPANNSVDCVTQVAPTQPPATGAPASPTQPAGNLPPPLASPTPRPTGTAGP